MPQEVAVPTMMYTEGTLAVAVVVADGMLFLVTSLLCPDFFTVMVDAEEVAYVCQTFCKAIN